LHTGNLHSSAESTWQACKRQHPDLVKSKAVILLGCGSPNNVYRYSHLPLAVVLKQAHDITQFNARLWVRAAHHGPHHMGGADHYNGMHLRLEGDSAYWLGHASCMVNHHTMYWTAYYAAATWTTPSRCT
jgi:hypothetical protein